MKKVNIIITATIAAATALVAVHVVYSGGVVPWFPISDSTSRQTVPAVTYNSSFNQYLVVWEDFRGSGYGCDVYAQFVNGDGSMTGINFAVSTANDWQRAPKAVYNPITDQYLVVWEDQRTYDIYGKLVNRGNPLTGSEFAISTATNSQRNPDVAYISSANKFFVAWTDDRLDKYDDDIYGKLVNADGSMASVDFPISIPLEDQLFPVIVHNSTDNQFLVVWQDDRNPATSTDIYARLVEANGTMVGPDFPISTATSDQDLPDAAYNPNSNQYLVVWKHGTKIYGRLINADKSFVGSEFPISSGSYTHYDPAVSFDTHNNQYLVTWSDSYGWDNIYARLVNADGSMDDPKFEFATGRGDFYYSDSTFNFLTNQFLVVWRHEICLDYGCDDYDTDIYGALYPEISSFEIYLPLVLRDAQ